MTHVKLVDSCLTAEALCKLVIDQVLAVSQAALSHLMVRTTQVHRIY